MHAKREAHAETYRICFTFCSVQKAMSVVHVQHTETYEAGLPKQGNLRCVSCACMAIHTLHSPTQVSTSVILPTVGNILRLCTKQNTHFNIHNCTYAIAMCAFSSFEFVHIYIHFIFHRFPFRRIDVRFLKPAIFCLTFAYLF